MFRAHVLFRAAWISALLLWPVLARANDGGITFGGSPGLLKAHPSITMERERIHLTVGEEMVTADCRFTFRNDGPKCTVRMGFPDQGEGADNPEEEGPIAHPRGTFRSFRSYVNGRAVATRLIRADRPGRYWHAKTVTFPARARVEVRDVYTVYVGGQISQINSLVRQTAYILHTGASWHGPIGRTDVVVTFRRKRMIAPLRPVPARNIEAVFTQDWSKERSRVYYIGPCRPVVEGMSLRFTRTNWRPRPQDDIRLFFDNYRANS